MQSSMIIPLLVFVIGFLGCGRIRENSRLTNEGSISDISASIITASVPITIEATETGYATSTIKINTLPVGNNFVPQLALIYSSSQAEKSLAGVGWSLSGLSTISRCPSYKIFNGLSKAITWDRNDSYCLDGKQLMPIAGNVEDGNAEFRLYIEEYKKITFVDDHFEVVNKNGEKMIFGTQSSSKEIGVNGKVYAFNLDKILDRSGNMISIRYEKDGERSFVVEVAYGGNDFFAKDNYRSLQFLYEKLIPTKKFIAGMKVEGDRLLKEIASYSNDQQVTSYRLTHEQADENKPILLSAIEQCFKDLSCTARTTFEYDASKNLNLVESKAYFWPEFSPKSNALWSKNQSARTIVDLNNDGHPDFLAIGKDRVSYSLSTEAGAGSVVEQMRKDLAMWNPLIDMFSISDMNRDGFSDIVLFTQYGERPGVYVAFWNGQGFSDFKRMTANFGAGWSIRNQIRSVVDVDNDGWLDVIGSRAEGIYVALNDHNGNLVGGDKALVPYFNGDEGWMNRDTPRYFVDVNGDGLIDVLGLFINEVRVSLGTGTGFSAPVVWLKGFGSNTYKPQTMPRQLMDMNSDGLVDLVGFNIDGVDVALNTGTSFAPPERWLNSLGVGQGWNNNQNQRLVFDVNMDGYPDFIGFKVAGAEIYLGKGRADVSQQPIKVNPFSDLMYPWKSSTDAVDIDDLDGNGRIDLYTSVPGGIWKAEFDSRNVKLIGVKTPFGEETRIAYKSIIDPVVYENNKIAAADVLRLTGSFPVVSEIRKSNGLGGFFGKRFRYENAAYHRDYFGFLGFEKRTIIDETAKTETVETYSQDTVGMTHGALISVEIYTNDGLRKQVSSNRTDYESVKLGTHALHRLLIEKANESKFYDEKGSLSYTVTTTKAFDGYQNAILVETATTDSFGIYKNRLQTQFINDESNWNIGLPQSIISTSTASGKSEIVRHTEFSYDQQGRMVSEITEPGSKFWQKTSYLRLRNSYGLVDTISQSWSPEEGVGLAFSEISNASEVDDRGFVTKTRNAMGHETSASYDAITGLLLSKKDPNGLETSYQYDGAFRIKSILNPDGRFTEISRSFCDSNCPVGAVFLEKKETKGFGYEAAYVDVLGRVIKSVNSLTSKQDVAVETVYNEKGLVSRTSKEHFVTDPAAAWSVFTYDIRNRPLTATRPGRGVESIVYEGLKTTHIDALGRQTVYQKDSRNLLLSLTNPKGEMISYTYDAMGKMIGLKDAGGNVTSFQYDIYGRQTSSLDPVRGLTTTHYNVLNQIVSEKRLDTTQQNTFDALGRVLTRKILKANTPIAQESMTYDTAKNGIGLPSSSNGSNSAVTYTYDPLSRPSETTEVLLGKSYTKSARYDQLGRLTQTVYPSGFTIEYGYDEVSQLTSIRDQLSKKAYWTLDDVYPSGEIKAYTLGNGSRGYRQLDEKSDDLVSESVSSSNSTLQMARSYDFDLVGNVVGRRDNITGNRESFTYDVLNRLESFAGTSLKTVTMKYDAMGRINERSDIGKYEYGVGCAGGLDSVFVIRRAGEKSYCADGRGNLTKAGFRTINYNAEDLPIEIQDGNKLIRYTYGIGRAVLSKDEIEGQERKLTRFVGDSFELEETSTHTLSRHYIGDFLVVELDGAGIRENYLYKDFLGSTLATADQSGTVLERLDYDPFGQRRDVNSFSWLSGFHPDTTSRGFTGHDHIDGVNLIHMKGRVYDPTIGLFLTPDPYIQDATSAQNLNRYSYVLNNPLKYTDPSGHFFKHIMKEIGRGFGSAGKAFRNPAPFLERSWGKLSRGASDPRYQRLAASIAISIVATIYCPYKAPEAWAQAAAYYAAVGSTSSYVATNGDKKAALNGAITGAAFNLVGSAFDALKAQGMYSQQALAAGKAIAHGVVGGLSAQNSGGKFESGFLSSGLSEFAGQRGMYGDADGSSGKLISGVARAAIVGGLISEASGGNFETGALNAAMGRLFNELSHLGSRLITKVSFWEKLNGASGMGHSGVSFTFNDGTVDFYEKYPTKYGALKTPSSEIRSRNYVLEGDFNSGDPDGSEGGNWLSVDVDLGDPFSAHEYASSSARGSELYQLIGNSCVDFARAVLRAGLPSNYDVYQYVNSPQMIPNEFARGLINVNNGVGEPRSKW